MSTPKAGSPSPLPPFTRHITTHNSTGEAIIHSSESPAWSSLANDTLGFSVAYTTSFPPDLNNETDIESHNSLIAANTLSLVNSGGTVCRVVDFAPASPGLMHRTQSLDYGIVLEGEIQMVLDSGETRIMKKGDIAVQRATMHEWRNLSETQWVRMLFVLQDCQPLVVGGRELGEDLGGKEALERGQ